jgi:hypothetical protein
MCNAKEDRRERAVKPKKDGTAFSADPKGPAFGLALPLSPGPSAAKIALLSWFTLENGALVW